MNIEETFDAAEELRNLNKNNGAGKSKSNKKRARKSFGMGYGDTKSSDKLVQGLQHELEPKFLLGQQFQQRSTRAKQNSNNNNNILLLKKNYTDVGAGKKDIVQRRLIGKYLGKYFL